MLDALYRLTDYIQYLLVAKDRHGVHSPFFYKLNDQVINKHAQNSIFEMIENRRRRMIKSDTLIDFEDHGSGNKSGKRKLSRITADTARAAKYGRLLFNILEYIRPEYSLELGTGTGITALYQAASLDPQRPLHSIEGSARLSEVAQFNAEKCGLEENIVFHQGTFDEVLPGILSQMPRVDFAYIDGNHSLEPTIRYFEMLLPKLHSNSVLVFDDINWSSEMKRAWHFIQQHPAVTSTVDIFAMGIVFFRRELSKEHFKIRY